MPSRGQSLCTFGDGTISVCALWYTHCDQRVNGNDSGSFYSSVPRLASTPNVKLWNNVTMGVFRPTGLAEVGLSILSTCLPAHNRIRAAAWRQNGSFLSTNCTRGPGPCAALAIITWRLCRALVRLYCSPAIFSFWFVSPQFFLHFKQQLMLPSYFCWGIQESYH